jgi:hypothetical protein
MSTFAESAVRLFVLLFAASWPNDHLGFIAAAGAVGAASVAAAAVSLACRYAVASVAVSPEVREKLAEIEPADVSVLQSQSDPDADGHARPRAPGRALAVA